MRLYVNQRVFSWTDRFNVKDSAGNDRYTVEGELFSWGKKLHVYDRKGREVALIQQKVWSFLPRYELYIMGRLTAEIVKEFTFLFPKYSIDGLGWKIDGSFWAHDYEITQNGRSVAVIHKEWMTWGDCYELDIANPEDELTVLAVMLTIDCVIAAQAAASNN